MSEIDYQALRDKAEKATCGEWSIEYGDGSFDGDDALIHREAAGYIPICRIEGAHPESGFDEDFQMEQQANAEFIAAANPATVLALLGELEAAKKRIAELEAELVSQTYKLNELSGNSPVTPDGWISCSERMPDNASYKWAKYAWNSINGYPGTVVYYQQRLYFAASTAFPQTIWASRTGDYKDFGKSNPTQDDDRIIYTYAGRQVNEIRHLIDVGSLVALTSGGEYVITGDQNKVLTPSSFAFSSQGSNGSSNVPPIAVANIALFVQEKGCVVRDLAYSFDVDGYAGFSRSCYCRTQRFSGTPADRDVGTERVGSHAA